MINLTLNVLATYTISVIITQERGPFAVFSRLQSWLETKRPSEPTAPSTNATPERWDAYQFDFVEYGKADEAFHSTLWGYAYALSSCPICLGAYASAFVVLWQGGGLIQWLAAYGGHLVLLKVVKE